MDTVDIVSSEATLPSASVINIKLVSSIINVPDPRRKRLVACGFVIIVSDYGIGPIGNENSGDFKMVV